MNVTTYPCSCCFSGWILSWRSPRHGYRYGRLVGDAWIDWTGHNDYVIRHLLRCTMLQTAGKMMYTLFHYNDVIMTAMASQFTGVSIVYSTLCSDADQRKHQSSASLVFVRGIQWWPMNSPYKGAVTCKMFPFDDVIMCDSGPWWRHTAS